MSNNRGLAQQILAEPQIESYTTGFKKHCRRMINNMGKSGNKTIYRV